MRRCRGFTLLELLLVVAIIGMLVGVVAPAVAGTGGSGTEAQIESDGNKVQGGVDNYSNKATRTFQWPEQRFGAKYKAPGGGTRTYLDKFGEDITHEDKNPDDPMDVIQGDGLSNFEYNHTELDFQSGTDVWQSDGTVVHLEFIPNFLLNSPSSLILNNDEGLNDSSGTMLHAFLCLMRVNSPRLEGESRRVEVYRLVDSKVNLAQDPLAVYQRIF